MIEGWDSEVARVLCAAVNEPDPEVAVEVLVTRTLDGFDCWKAPVNLDEIAEELGIDGIRPEFCQGDGYLFNDGRNCWIGVNCEVSTQRQRFTAAHEIVHFLLPTYESGTHLPSKPGQFRRIDEEEYLCDLGASYILMPRSDFLRIANHETVSAARILHLSHYFDVSLEAAIVTSCNRIEAPFLVAKWQPNDHGGMSLGRVYRSRHLGNEFWLEPYASVSPTHDIARLSMGQRAKHGRPEFCLTRNGKKIYMHANHLLLGGIGSSVLSVFTPNSRNRWTPARVVRP